MRDHRGGRLATSLARGAMGPNTQLHTMTSSLTHGGLDARLCTTVLHPAKDCWKNATPQGNTPKGLCPPCGTDHQPTAHRSRRISRPSPGTRHQTRPEFPLRADPLVSARPCQVPNMWKYRRRGAPLAPPQS